MFKEARNIGARPLCVMNPISDILGVRSAAPISPSPSR